jgi:hypothetical protein
MWTYRNNWIAAVLIASWFQSRPLIKLWGANYHPPTTSRIDDIQCMISCIIWRLFHGLALKFLTPWSPEHERTGHRCCGGNMDICLVVPYSGEAAVSLIGCCRDKECISLYSTIQLKTPGHLKWFFEAWPWYRHFFFVISQTILISRFSILQ